MTFNGFESTTQKTDSMVTAWVSYRHR